MFYVFITDVIEEIDNKTLFIFGKIAFLIIIIKKKTYHEINSLIRKPVIDIRIAFYENSVK